MSPGGDVFTLGGDEFTRGAAQPRVVVDALVCVFAVRARVCGVAETTTDCVSSELLCASV